MIVPRRSVIKPASSSVREAGRRWGMNWLALARWAWLVVALLLAGNFVASIPAYYTTLRTVCTFAAAQCGWQPTPANIVALARLHIPVSLWLLQLRKEENRQEKMVQTSPRMVYRSRQ